MAKDVQEQEAERKRPTSQAPATGTAVSRRTLHPFLPPRCRNPNFFHNFVISSISGLLPVFFILFYFILFYLFYFTLSLFCPSCVRRQPGMRVSPPAGDGFQQARWKEGRAAARTRTCPQWKSVASVYRHTLSFAHVSCDITSRHRCGMPLLACQPPVACTADSNKDGSQ